MLELLTACHQRELQREAPCKGITNIKHTKGLVERGFLTASIQKDPVTGKSYMAFLITQSGRDYLAKHHTQDLTEKG